MSGSEPFGTPAETPTARALRQAGIIAGVFALLVCGLLLANNVRMKAASPLDSTELASLKEDLLKHPGDEALKRRIRTLDVRLRREYFRRQRFSAGGAYLLLGAVVVFVAALRFAASGRKMFPDLALPAGGVRQQLRVAARGRWSMGVLAGLLAVATVVLLLLPAEQDLTASAAVSAGDAAGASSVPAEGASATAAELLKRSWPRFRGPGGAGATAWANVPAAWNGRTGAGILWKSPVPLPGMNSPVVWDDRVFVCGADAGKREIYCFAADSGRLLWRTSVRVARRDASAAPEVFEDTGLAAPTVATDGRRVYAMFANGDVAGVDFAGRVLWSRTFGPLENDYGHASSLSVDGGRLLVLLDQAAAEDARSILVALDVRTGDIVWKTDRRVPNSWASPIVIQTAAGRQVITCGDPWVIAYDAATGGEIWRAECLSGDVAPSPIYANGLILAVSPEDKLVAIRPGGRGDVTETHIAWSAEDGIPDISSPVSDGKRVFLITTGGQLTCYDLADGRKVWEKDLEAGFWSSPSLVDGRLYLLSEDGVMFIVAAASAFQEIGRAELGEPVRTCPAFQEGRIYIRARDHLYCIGSPNK